MGEYLGPLQPGWRISWVPVLLDHRAGPAPASLGGWEMAQVGVAVRGRAPFTL